MYGFLPGPVSCEIKSTYGIVCCCRECLSKNHFHYKALTLQWPNLTWMAFLLHYISTSCSFFNSVSQSSCLSTDQVVQQNASPSPLCFKRWEKVGKNPDQAVIKNRPWLAGSTDSGQFNLVSTIFGWFIGTNSSWGQPNIKHGRFLVQPIKPAGPVLKTLIDSMTNKKTQYIPWSSNDLYKYQPYLISLSSLSRKSQQNKFQIPNSSDR